MQRLQVRTTSGRKASRTTHSPFGAALEALDLDIGYRYRFNAHRKCEEKVPMDCPGEAPKGWHPEYTMELDLPVSKTGDADSDNDFEDSQDGRTPDATVPQVNAIN